MASHPEWPSVNQLHLKEYPTPLSLTLCSSPRDDDRKHGGKICCHAWHLPWCNPLHLLRKAARYRLLRRDAHQRFVGMWPSAPSCGVVLTLELFQLDTITMALSACTVELMVDPSRRRSLWEWSIIRDWDTWCLTNSRLVSDLEFCHISGNGWRRWCFIYRWEAQVLWMWPPINPSKEGSVGEGCGLERWRETLSLLMALPSCSVIVCSTALTDLWLVDFMSICIGVGFSTFRWLVCCPLNSHPLVSAFENGNFMSCFWCCEL